MLRETQKAVNQKASASRRVAIVLTDNGNGTYDVSMDSARLNSVPSVSFARYRVGARVLVNLSGARPVIEP